ncbi:hypothetical protein [Amycolatopsis vancoresmycina]|uniref:DUF3592 domain-containing protein n=1 Tax=Amycolatopsis vancoresmycina DSM 44592 TaxID=1292037 RepID=R1FYM6_9PSEU|nr:hypothetical protein [Amycolatopsis vancoresmycina]EOD64397.1 hypothetical protein H480_32036 [Amycolatopsis vancoresmycina DSM 44592]
MRPPGDDPDGALRRSALVGVFGGLLLLALLLAGVFGVKTYDQSRSQVLVGRVTAVDDGRQRISVAYTVPDGSPVTRTFSTRSSKRGSHPAGAAVGVRYWPTTGRVVLDGGLPPVAGLVVGAALLPIAAAGFVVSLRRNRSRASSSSA